MKKTNINNIFLIILTLNFIVRLIATYFYGDTRLDNEWAKLVHNLELTGTFGINVVFDKFTALHDFAKDGDVVLPSVFMPPLYGYLIYFVKIISFDLIDIAFLIINIQIVISLITILIFFKLISNFQNVKVSLLFSLIFSLFPIYIFASVQISSVVLQLFFIIIFLFSIVNLLKKQNYLYLTLFSIVSGLLILTRGEFILFYFFSIFYFFVYLKRSYKNVIISIILTSLIITPYLKRNFENYGTLVLTKSVGYNLLKGNNPLAEAEGNTYFITKNFSQKNLKIETNNKYELELDDFYKNQAIKIINNNPVKYLKLYFKKVIAFLFVDINSTYPQYYNLLNIFPKLLLSFFAFLGGIFCLRKKGFFQFLSFYYFGNIFLFSTFFILPRYSLILLPVQILLSLEIIKLFFRKLNNQLFNNFFS